MTEARVFVNNLSRVALDSAPTTRSRVPHGARDQHTLVIQVRRINEVWWSGKEISRLSPVLKHALLMN